MSQIVTPRTFDCIKIAKSKMSDTLEYLGLSSIAKLLLQKLYHFLIIMSIFDAKMLNNKNIEMKQE